MIALAHPALLWTGIGLVSVPILIHLFFRRRHRVVRWAAMEFLLAALKKQKRRMEVENLILLLLRCALIFLLALAIARPAVEAAGLNPFGGGARAVVLVVDTSTSMDRKPTARSALDRAKVRASQFANELPAGSKLTLLVTRDDSAGGAPRALLENASPNEVRARIPGIQLAHGPNDLGSVLRAAGEKLAALRGRRLVVFITDLQRRDWYGHGGINRDENVYQALKSLDRDDGGEPTPVTLIDVGNDDAGNVVMTDLSIGRGRQAFAGNLLGVTATLVNYGKTDARGTLALYMARDDGQWEKLPDTAQITIEPTVGFGAGKATPYEFRTPLPAKAEGPLRLRAAFEPAETKANDRVALDSQRHLALRVRPPVRILAVRSIPQAMEVLRDVELLDVIDLAPEIYPAELATVDLTAIDIIVWADAEAAGLAAEDATRIDRFVRLGGGLLAYLGDYSEELNRQFVRDDGTGLLPSKLLAMREDDEHPVLFELDDKTTQAHPLFKDTKKFFFSPEVTGYRRMAEVPELEVVARYDNGDPAVVDHRAGRGRVILVTTTPDPRGYRLNGSLLPAILFFNAAHYLVWEDPGRLNVSVGDEVTIPLPSGAGRVVVVTPPPAAGGVVEEPVGAEADEYVLTGTTHPGFFRMLVRAVSTTGAAVPTETAFDAAVNLDPAEGDLRRATPDQLSRDFTGVPLHFTDEVESVLPEAAAGDQSDISRILLGAVAAILFLELILAWRFGIRRRATA